MLRALILSTLSSEIEYIVSKRFDKQLFKISPKPMSWSTSYLISQKIKFIFLKDLKLFYFSIKKSKGLNNENVLLCLKKP